MELGSLGRNLFGSLDKTRGDPELQKISDALAQGRKEAQAMADQFAAQRRSSAQAAFGRAQELVTTWKKNAYQLAALGGDLTMVARMTDSALRMAQPSIKVLKDGAGTDEGLNLSRQVAHLANEAQHVEILAGGAVSTPNSRKSAKTLARTIDYMRALGGFKIAV